MAPAQPKLWNRNFLQCWISYFFLNFSYQMLTPIVPLYLIEQMGVLEAEAGVVLASYTAGVLIIRPFSGYLVDCFSRKSLYAISFALFALMFMGYWVASLPIIMIIVRFIQGSCMGVASVSGNTIAIDVIPSERRGEGMGFYGLAINMAMALSQVVAIYTYTAYGFNILVAVALAMALLGGLSVTQISYPPREKVARPVLSLDRFILLRALPTALTFMLVEAPYGMLLSFAIIFGKEIGVENPSAFFITLAAGVAVARLISGRLIDRGYIHPVSISSIVLLTISLALFSLVRSDILFYLFGSLLGLCYGICVPAFQALFVNVAPNNMRGTATSTYLSSFDLGSGLGMVLAGWVAQYYGLAQVYQVGAVIALVALVIYITKVKKSYEINRLEY